MNNLEQEIKEVLGQIIGEPAEKIDPGKEFSQMPNIDSVAMLQFLVLLEEKYSVKFELDKIDETFQSINNIVKYLTKNETR